MTRRAKFAFVTLAVIILLFLAAYVAFMDRDDRLAATFRFAVNEPEAALKQIVQIAERRGTLVGSGIGVVIPERESTILGRTQWIISPDGVIRGAAPKRGLVVTLTPAMRDGRVTWNCKVEPERQFMPATCRFLEQVNR